jgi:polysaccharide biosynthesis/export protein
MKKRASFWGFVFFTLAVPQLLSGCMETAQTSKPVGGETAMGTLVTEQPASASALASGQTAMAEAPTNRSLVAERPASASVLASADTATGDYRISSRDILQVAVFQVKDLDGTVQVSEDGNVALPLVGKVQLRGKTTQEAEQIIAGKLREKYLQSPQVSVSIKQYGKRITVSGEVKAPRVIDDDGGTTLTQAIAGAGGFSELADTSRVHVARSKDQHIQDEVYNIDTIQAGKAADPLLKGGDIVVAEQSGTRVALKNVKDLLPFAILASVM